MKNKTLKLLLALIAVVLFAVVCLLRTGLWEPRLSAEPYTTVALYWFNSSICDILVDDESSIDQLLHSSSSDNLKTSLINLFRDRGFDTAADFLIDPDGWGRPYNIEWRTNLIDKLSPMLTSNSNELLIWSSGPNGINEYGGGDDFHISCDWEDYREAYRAALRNQTNTNNSANN